MQRHPLYHSLVNLQQWEVSRKIWSIEIRPTEFHIRSSFLSASRISAPLCTLPKSWRNLGRKFARRLLWSRWRKLEYARDGWNVEEARFRLKGFAVSIQIQLSSLTAIREFFSLSLFLSIEYDLEAIHLFRTLYLRSTDLESSVR